VLALLKPYSEMRGWKLPLQQEEAQAAFIHMVDVTADSLESGE
jgi:hypothetical protein